MEITKDALVSCGFSAFPTMPNFFRIDKPNPYRYVSVNFDISGSISVHMGGEENKYSEWTEFDLPNCTTMEQVDQLITLFLK